MLHLIRLWPLLALLIPIQLSGQCTPTPVVYNGLVASLGPDGTVSLPAAVFDAGSRAGCNSGGMTFSYSADSLDTHKTFDCSSVGNTEVVDIWVTNLAGGQTFARTFVLIQDKLGVCSAVTLDCGPSLIVYNGLSIDISAGPLTIPATIFAAASIDQCQTGQLSLEVGFSGSGVFGGHITFDCNSNPFNAVEIRVTDALGNQNIVETFVSVSDEQDYCGGNSPISNCGPAPVLVSGLVIALPFPATGQINLPQPNLFIDAIDGCGSGSLRTTITESGGTPNYQQNRFALYCDDIGTKLVTGYVQDLNGNEAFAESYVVVQDNIAPQIDEESCAIDNLNINLRYYPGETVLRTTSLVFILGSDNCGDIQLSFSPDDPSQNGYPIDCSVLEPGETSTTIYVPVWAFDKGGNTAACQVPLKVHDNFGYCNNDCTGEQYNFEQTPPKYVYRASDYIEASCTISEANGSHRIFQAANSVRLLPGFRTTENALFVATAAPCTLVPEPFVADLPLENVQDLQVMVFPNPVTSQSRIQVSLPEAAPLQVLLSDQTGRLIKELANHTLYDEVYWETDLSNTDLPAGIYFLQVRNGTQQIVKKLISLR